MRIGIIGAGLTGLTAAFDLVRRGHQVTLWEKENEVGGEAAAFDLEGNHLEKFYHHIFMSDKALLELLAELGLASSLQWLPSHVGYYYGGKIHNFTTPIDLLRFTPLGIIDRFRLGLVSLYLQRYTQWQNFEGITAQEWLLKRGGQRSYEVIWGPLLRGKFGDSASQISMAWLWGRIRMRLGSRRQGIGQERLGYLKGSFGRLVEALAQRVRNGGGAIHLGTPIKRLAIQDGRVAGAISATGEMFPQDAIIATIPSPPFLAMAPELPAEYAVKAGQTRYLAALCLVITLDRQFTPVYWLNIGDLSFPFVATIEQTNFVNPSEYGGKRILYVSNYLPASSPLFKLTAGELLKHYLPFLQKITPQFDTNWVGEYHVFKEEYAQPVVPINYSGQIPAHKTPIKGLYLANTTQIYPEDRGMNQAVQLGFKVAGLVNQAIEKAGKV